MRRSTSSRHVRDSRSQSARSGVRSSGRIASAAWISASGIPAAFPAWMTAIRRSVERR